MKSAEEWAEIYKGSYIYATTVAAIQVDAIESAAQKIDSAVADYVVACNEEAEETSKDLAREVRKLIPKGQP